VEESIKKILEDEVSKLGVYIDSVNYVNEGGNNYLRIIIDSGNTIDIDKCVEVTEAINPILDKENIIDESYILDVCTKEKGEN